MLLDVDFPTDLEQSFNAGALNSMMRMSTAGSATASSTKHHTVNTSYCDTPHVPDSDIREGQEAVCSEQQDFYSCIPNSRLWDNCVGKEGSSWQWQDPLPTLFYPQERHPNMKRIKQGKL